MIKYSIFVVLVIFLVSCNSISKNIPDTGKTWVYVELEVVTNDTDYYYYFGQVNQKSLDELETNQGSSLFILRNVRYYDDFDKIQQYADDFDDGTLFFRKDDIVKLEVLKYDPLNNSKKDTTAIKKNTEN